jgi:hypothetical protein
MKACYTGETNVPNLAAHAPKSAQRICSGLLALLKLAVSALSTTFVRKSSKIEHSVSFINP